MKSQLEKLFELLLSAQPAYPGQRGYQILLAMLFVVTLSLVHAEQHILAGIVFLIDFAVSMHARHRYKRWKKSDVAQN